MVFNTQNVLSLNNGKVEKLILDPGPDPDQSQNLIDSSVANVASIHQVSWKPVDKFFNNLTHRQTNKQMDKKTDKPSKVM